MKKYTEEQWAALHRYLLKCGCPVQPEQCLKLSPMGLSIQQLPNVGVSTVFDLQDGRSGYVMDMQITNEAKSQIRSSDVQITPPWGLSRLSLLPDPSTFKRGYEMYDFPDGSLGFDRSVVVNGFLSGKCKLNPGSEISGLLLGIDENPIPNDLPEFGRTVVEFAIFDNRGNKFESQFKLCVDRSATFDRERKRKASALSRSKSRLRLRVHDAA